MRGGESLGDIAALAVERAKVRKCATIVDADENSHAPSSPAAGAFWRPRSCRRRPDTDGANDTHPKGEALISLKNRWLSDEAEAPCRIHGLHPISDAEFLVDILQMPLDGVGRDGKSVSQILRRHAVTDEDEHLGLAHG